VTLTLGNTKEIDLLVSNEEGKKVSIDVKGLKNTTNWVINPKLKRKDHFFVLVCFKNKFLNLTAVPEVFVVPSLEIDKILESWAGRPDVHCVNYSKIRKTDYKDRWDLLFKKK
jgi:hypothetical protein